MKQQKPSARIKEIIVRDYGEGMASPEESNRIRFLALLEYLDEQVLEEKTWMRKSID